MATIQGRAPAVVTWGTNVVKRMSLRMRYTIRRIFTFFLVIWVAASLNFFLPRLAPGRDPVRERLGALQATGGSFQEGINEMVEAYQAKFGLDEPLWKQYFRYLGDAFTFDFGYSLQNYPATVRGLILDALPWTLGLLLVSTLLAFTIGTFAGALLGWERAPKALQYLLAPFLTLSSIPYYLLGIILVYYFAFKVRAFPLSGGYEMGAQPEWSVEFALDVLNHSFLPAVSIILAQIGFWSLGMRAMMVTVQGEDYMTLAEAKGLRPFVIFLKYGARNALLPQTTSLALALGTIVSQAILVEVVFAYPGIGTLLYRAIGGFDYFLIYGIVLVIIVAIGLTTLILDLVYPFLDPRITYERR